MLPTAKIGAAVLAQFDGILVEGDPGLRRRSLGTLAILRQIALAVRLGLPYLYLGYWIKDSPKMAYKVDFWPLERWRDGRWELRRELRDDGTVQDRAIALFRKVIQPCHVARVRKLLAHRSEIDRISGLVERKGYTLVPTAMYWKKGNAKLEIGLARGKKEYDKRETIRRKDTQRDIERDLKGRT